MFWATLVRLYLYPGCLLVNSKSFPGASRTKLENQLQRAAQVSANARSIWSTASSGTRTAIARRAPRNSPIAKAARSWRPGKCDCWAGNGACSSRCATLCWSPWRSRVARSPKSLLVIQSLSPLTRLCIGGLYEVARLQVQTNTSPSSWHRCLRGSAGWPIRIRVIR